MVYRKTPKVKKKLDNREKAILEAARQVLAEKSYHEASVKSIAQKAGIAAGTFYLYFRNKEALFNSLVDEVYNELLDAIRFERSKHTGVLDKLKASMEVCAKLFVKEKKLAKILLVQLPTVNNLLNNILTELEDELIKLTKQDLDEAVSANLLPPQDTFVSATAFVGTFHQVVISWLRKGEPADLQEAFQTLMQYNFQGLGVKGEIV